MEEIRNKGGERARERLEPVIAAPPPSGRQLGRGGDGGGEQTQEDDGREW